MIPVSVLLADYDKDITFYNVLHRARCIKCGLQCSDQMRLVFFGKSAMAHTATDINNDSHKDTEIYH